MGYKDIDGLSSGTGSDNSPTILQADGQTLDLPDASFVRDADIIRDGMNLVLDGPDGTIVVEGYFGAETPPNLIAPGGLSLTPDLIESFAKAPPEFAGNASMSDVSPVGEVSEVSGDATVIRADGTSEHVTLGTPIYQGDVIETDADGAVNIVFVDETSFAVSEEARLAIDEYVFDPATQSGTTDFSVLKGVFVFTSGLIGRDDPDDVAIDTPIGSIGIRGTIIAGDVNSGEITVVEGAIVLRDGNGNEMTLANQFETARFDPLNGTIDNMGELSAQEVGDKFASVSQVSPGLFSSVQDAAAEQTDAPTEGEQPAENEARDAEGAADDDGDGDVDGTVSQEDGESEAAADGESAVEGQADDGGETLPPPPPPSSTTTTGFETNTGGTTTSLSSGTGTITTTTTLALAGTTTTQTSPPPPPSGSDTTTDPLVLAGSTTTNTAPFHHGHVPAEFFNSAEGQTWFYHFNKEFGDTGPNAGNLHYKLSNTTINTLNSLSDVSLDVLQVGVGQGLANVAGDENKGWSFNSSTGKLELFFSNNFAPSITAGDSHDFYIEVRAIDSGGLSSALHSYHFDAWNDTSTFVNTLVGGSHDNWVITDMTASAQTVTIGSSGNAVFGSKVFLGDMNDTVYIQEGSFTNDVYLGDGANLVYITDGYDNTVVGGFGDDSFTLNKIDNDLFGMDGDDDFTLILDGGFITNTLENVATANSLVIDGGWNNFRADIKLTNYGLNSPTHPQTINGRGDSLILQSSGAETLDFTAIDDSLIQNIERLVLGGGNQTVTLNYNDVLSMTDEGNTLIIRLNSGDTVNFEHMSGLNKVADNVLIDDNRSNSQTATTSDDVLFDIYSDGNVTLLVEDAGGTVNGIPAL